MTNINIGQLWRIAKNPNGAGHIIRSSSAVHRSPRVHSINRQFAEAATSCKGAKGRSAFRNCVAEKMKGKHAE